MITNVTLNAAPHTQASSHNSIKHSHRNRLASLWRHAELMTKQHWTIYFGGDEIYLQKKNPSWPLAK